MERSVALLAALAVTSSVAACGAGDGAPASLTTSASARASAPSTPVDPSPVAATPTDGPGAPAATPAPSDEGEGPEFSPASGLVTGDPSGGPLTVRAVRVAGHEGYDRVVFELAGRAAGQAGWRVEYVEGASQQGSGEAVEVDGEAVLSVLISGTGYPMDTGVEEVTDDPALPAGLGVVTDVALGAVFEGQYEAFLGTRAQAPFRVFRLGDPERVVVDVQAP